MAHIACGVVRVWATSCKHSFTTSSNGTHEAFHCLPGACGLAADFLSAAPRHCAGLGSGGTGRRLQQTTADVTAQLAAVLVQVCFSCTMSKLQTCIATPATVQSAVTALWHAINSSMGASIACNVRPPGQFPIRVRNLLNPVLLASAEEGISFKTLYFDESLCAVPQLPITSVSLYQHVRNGTDCNRRLTA